MSGKEERFHGGCHCGSVKFTFKVKVIDDESQSFDLEPILSCNCSICSATGFLHLLIAHQDFELLTDINALTSYKFGTMKANHLFCSKCGIKSYYQPRSHPEHFSVNVNCLPFEAQEKFLAKLAVNKFDGRNWEKAQASRLNMNS